MRSGLTLIASKSFAFRKDFAIVVTSAELILNAAGDWPHTCATAAGRGSTPSQHAGPKPYASAGSHKKLTQNRTKLASPSSSIRALVCVCV